MTNKTPLCYTNNREKVREREEQDNEEDQESKTVLHCRRLCSARISEEMCVKTLWCKPRGSRKDVQRHKELSTKRMYR